MELLDHGRWQNRKFCRMTASQGDALAFFLCVIINSPQATPAGSIMKTWDTALWAYSQATFADEWIPVFAGMTAKMW